MDVDSSDRFIATELMGTPGGAGPVSDSAASVTSSRRALCVTRRRQLVLGDIRDALLGVWPDCGMNSKATEYTLGPQRAVYSALPCP